MRFFKLGIAWSVCWGILVVLLIALWVRSYWVADYFQLWRSHAVVSLQGTLFIDEKIILETSSTNVSAGLAETNRFLAYSLPTRLFNFYPQGSGLAVPYWLIATFAAALAAASWVSWPTSFSLRTLLIATTLIAVLLGLIVWTVRR